MAFDKLNQAEGGEVARCRVQVAGYNGDGSLTTSGNCCSELCRREVGAAMHQAFIFQRLKRYAGIEPRGRANAQHVQQGQSITVQIIQDITALPFADSV
jgi:hypothetical protein